MKKYYIKAYDSDGGFLKNIDPRIVMSDIAFNSEINGGQGELTIDLNMKWDAPEDWTAPFNFIKVFVVDRTRPLGKNIYTGFISQRVPFLSGRGNGIQIVCLGLVSLLALSYYKDGASFDVTHTSEDPGDVVKDAIDHFQSTYPGTPEWVGYTQELDGLGRVIRQGGNIDNTGVNITKEFSKNQWVEVLDEMVELAGEDWYWFIDGTGDVFFKEKPSTATHILTIGRSVQFIEPAENTEDIKNSVTLIYDGGTTAAQEDATSIADYGRREVAIEDLDITDSSTALIKAQTILEDLKSPKVEATIEVNDKYDYESIRPGDTVRLRNYKMGSVVLGDNMLVVSVRYSPNFCRIQLEGKRYDMSRDLKNL